MLKKEQISAIAALLKITPTEFEAALTDAAEKEIKLPEGELMTKADLASRDTAIKKTGYDEGKGAAIEMLIKEQKTALGLEFEGKDPSKFLEAYSAKVLADAKVAPNEVIKEKDNIIQSLRTNITKLESEKAEIAGQVGKVKLETGILRSIPTNLSGVEPEELLASMRLKGFDFAEQDGAIVAKKDGQLVADNALKPLNISDVIKGYASERKWLADEGASGKTGRGDGHSRPKGTTPTTLKEAEKEYAASGKNTGTADFQRYIEGLAKENPQFDLNN